MEDLNDSIWYPTRIFDTVLELYPGLFDCSYNSDLELVGLYFADKTISEVRLLMGDCNKYNIYLQTADATEDHYSEVTVELKLEYPGGLLSLPISNRLSDNTCMGIFNHNISIRAVVRNPSTDSVIFRTNAYDEAVIRRRHTIKNIISDEM